MFGLRGDSVLHSYELMSDSIDSLSYSYDTSQVPMHIDSPSES